MQIVWDSSVSAENQALVQSADDGCSFPLDFVPASWTVQVVPNPGHEGKAEALTTVTVSWTGELPTVTAVTQFAPGLFIPGNAIYVDQAFITECVIHELGHVVTLWLHETDQADFGICLGFDYATQWDPPGATGATNAWYHAGKEAVAETFKDYYAHERHFDNRTDFQLPEWASLYFQSTLLEGLRDRIVPLTGASTTVIAASGLPMLVVDAEESWLDVPGSIPGYKTFDSSLLVTIRVHDYTTPADGASLQIVSCYFVRTTIGTDFTSESFALSGEEAEVQSSDDPWFEGQNAYIIENVGVYCRLPVLRSSAGDVAVPISVGYTGVVTNPAWSLDYDSLDVTFSMWIIVQSLFNPDEPYGYYLVLDAGGNAEFELVAVEQRHSPLSVVREPWPYAQDNAATLVPGSIETGNVKMGTVR